MQNYQYLILNPKYPVYLTSPRNEDIYLDIIIYYIINIRRIRYDYYKEYYVNNYDLHDTDVYYDKYFDELGYDQHLIPEINKLRALNYNLTIFQSMVEHNAFQVRRIFELFGVSDLVENYYQFEHKEFLTKFQDRLNTSIAQSVETNLHLQNQLKTYLKNLYSSTQLSQLTILLINILSIFNTKLIKLGEVSLRLY